MHVQSKVQRNLDQMYAATNGIFTQPANTPIPGVVRTDRNHLSEQQIAQRYLKSVGTNANLDINKCVARNLTAQPRIVQKKNKRLIFFGAINAGIGKFCKSVTKPWPT